MNSFPNQQAVAVMEMKEMVSSQPETMMGR